MSFAIRGNVHESVIELEFRRAKRSHTEIGFYFFYFINNPIIRQ